MQGGGSRPDLYVDTAAGLLAYDLSPESILRLLDILYDEQPVAEPVVIDLAPPTREPAPAPPVIALDPVEPSGPLEPGRVAVDQ